LLKYAFSEADHLKSVSQVEIDRAGRCRIERIRLTPRRDLRVLEGYLKDLLDGPAPGENREDYLAVRLLDRTALLDPMGKLREIYPNLLHLERPGLLEAGELGDCGREQLRRSEQALFASFFEQVTGAAPSQEENDAFATVVDSLGRSEREAV
jgi:exonuclease SbcD